MKPSHAVVSKKPGPFEFTINAPPRAMKACNTVTSAVATSRAERKYTSTPSSERAVSGTARGAPIVKVAFTVPAAPNFVASVIVARNSL